MTISGPPHNSKPLSYSQAEEEKSQHQSAIRIAGVYLVAGLVWIAASDSLLALLGGLTINGLLVSIAKGMSFVLLSTALVYWLALREYKKIQRATSLLRAVIEGTSDAVFVKDLAGRYLLVNAAAAKFIGRPVPEVLGCDDSVLFTAEEATRVMVNDQSVINSKEVTTLEETLTIGGAPVVYLATKAPFFDSEGRVNGLIGISRDITNYKRVEAALRETDARLREAQRIAKLGSWSWEPIPDKVWWSDAEFELFGVDPSTVEPSFEKFLALLHPDDRSIAIARVASFDAGVNEVENDLRVIRPDGTCIWIRSQARTTRDASGKLIRVEGIDQDITAQRLANEARLESERRLNAAVELAGLGVMVIDYDRQIAELTPKAADHFGFRGQAIVPRSQIHARFHSADVDELKALINEATDPAGSGSIAFEHRVVHADGSVHWLNARKQVTFADGRPLRAVVVTADVTERKQAEARYREQEMLMREAAELAQVGGWGFDPVKLEVDWTPTVANIYGVDPNTPPMLNEAFNFFIPEQRPALEAAMSAAIKEGIPHDLELQLIGADGVKRWVRTICRPIVEDGRVIRVRGSLQDISDRMRAESELRASEERFRHAQKMEAIGRLAGGVAHDFNNLLTVINGYCDLILSRLAEDDPTRGPLVAIHDAGDRAAKLTKQLLAFSRHSMAEPKAIDLNEFVVTSAELIRRLIGEDIILSVLTAPTPVKVMLDPGQLEQVLINLAVNARDAMPTGGRLTIETSILDLKVHSENKHGGLPEDTYALLQVSDTGCGMTPEVQEKIFEPFFTTKGIGKGTGLGLAVVHGIVEQSGGTIKVESKVGGGSSFQIVFPSLMESSRESAITQLPSSTRGSETLLVVEDEDAVRHLLQVALRQQGYTVLAASGGREALEMMKSASNGVDLLITDVIMPEISGSELAAMLRTQQPGLRVLYISGYADDVLDRHGLLESLDQFIHKPFMPLALASKVREILNG